jgi:hypothetical protein
MKIQKNADTERIEYYEADHRVIFLGRTKPLPRTIWIDKPSQAIQC